MGHRSLNSTGGLWYVAPKSTVILLSIFILIRGLPLMFRYNVEMQSFEALQAANLPLAVVLIWVLATVSNIVIVYRVFKLFFGSPNSALMPSEIAISEYTVPLITIIALIYSPFI